LELKTRTGLDGPAGGSGAKLCFVVLGERFAGLLG